MDFFSMNLNFLPKNNSSLKFNKHKANILSLCLPFHITWPLLTQNLPDPKRPLQHQRFPPADSQLPQDCRYLHQSFCWPISLRKRQCIYCWWNLYKSTRPQNTCLTHHKSRYPFHHRLPDIRQPRNCGPCIPRHAFMAFLRLTEQPENFKFIADGYNDHPLVAMKFVSTAAAYDAKVYWHKAHGLSCPSRKRTTALFSCL